MILRSDEARQRLEQVEEEIGAFDRRCGSLTIQEQSQLVGLRIRRNLLRGVLQGRMIEGERKIVSLERWRHGFAPAAIVQRFGHLLEAAPDTIAVAAPDDAEDDTPRNSTPG